jgi:hypothetical protein
VFERPVAIVQNADAIPKFGFLENRAINDYSDFVDDKTHLWILKMI